MVSPTGDDANDGRSWQTAKLTVEDAIDSATAGGEIWVAEGTYEENIELSEGVSVYGGFAGTEGSRDQRDPETNETILDGGEAGSVVTSPSGVTTATVIDGFTITNGSAQYGGGGIRCYMSSPTITQNVIVDNTITLNSANNGAGVYDEGFYPVISGNTITENTATNYGGGISCFFDVMPSITNNIIVDNSAAYGGGIDCRYDCWAVIANNTIYDNAASTNGGGISIYDSYPTITNNIVVSNSSGIYSDDSSPSVDYNDVYNNTSYNYSGLSAGANDISSDPSFVNAGQGDYHLQSGSPCIDTGTNTGAPATDKDGVSRPQDGDGSPPAICDIAAYEIPEP